ncbi:MAG: hypothetical protein QNK05_07435 [Myxococcota bacterium]|nr:hypothetical protein [Myxococcota bacterium]
MTHRCYDPYRSRRQSDRDRESRESRGDRYSRREGRRHRRRERKERVLHTRISQKLSDDIRNLADDLRVPVSNLVRNVLEEAFSVVEEMSDDVGEILDDVINEAEGATERFRRFQANRRARYRADEELRATERRGEGAETDARDDALREAAEAEAESAGEIPTAGDVTDTDDTDADTGEDAPAPVTGAFADVVAWQPVILNAPQRCARTGQSIRPGEEGFMGITAQGFGGVYLSREGLDELHSR